MNTTHAPDEIRCVVLWLKYRSTFSQGLLMLRQIPRLKVKLLKGNSREKR